MSLDILRRHAAARRLLDEQPHVIDDPHKLGAQARSVLAVLQGRDLVSVGASSWQTLNAAWRKFAMRTIMIQTTSSFHNPNTLKADDGVDYTVQAANENNSDTLFNAFEVTGRWRAKYGTGTTAPTDTDFDIETQAGNTLTVQNPTFDDTNYRATISASEVHSGVSINVSEVAAFVRYQTNQSTATFKDFLVDRSLPTAQTLQDTQTVVISYVFQF